jgi:O-antigen/teichoic acid export membrane protein
VLLALAAPAIASRWLTFSSLTIADVRTALLLMSAGLPALVTRAIYMAALNGLQQQRTVNVIQVGGVLVRSVASIAALLIVPPTATVLLVVSVVLFYVEVVVAALALRAAWPPSAGRGRIRIATLQPVLGFTAGMAGTMLLGLVLTTMDRVVLSAILPLAELGYYTLAVTVAAALGHVVGPVTTAVSPRFSQLFERRDAMAAASEYHFFSQLVTVVVMPLAILLVFFPDVVLATWTGDTHLARLAAPVLSLRTIGMVLNVLLHVPHVVQLASGWSTLGAGVNAVAVLVMIPLLLVLSLQWGGAGAALAWVLLNLGVFVVLMERMHRRVLAGELTTWLARIVMPVLAATVVGGLARLAMPAALSGPARLAWLAITALLTGLATLGVAPLVRDRLAAARRLS